MKSSQPLDLSSGFIDIETEQSQIVITQATEARCLKMLKTYQYSLEMFSQNRMIAIKYYN